MPSVKQNDAVADDQVPDQPGVAAADDLVPDQPGVAAADDLVPDQPGVAAADDLVPDQPGVAAADDLVPDQPDNPTIAVQLVVAEVHEQPSSALQEQTDDTDKHRYIYNQNVILVKLCRHRRPLQRPIVVGRSHRGTR